MKIYEKPIAEVVNFNTERVMSEPGVTPSPGTSEDVEL